jgi:hypothetical protein
MKWTPIQDQAAADQLMREFGDFHDGCLHELHLWTGYSVSPDFSMTVAFPSNIGARVLIQRQSDTLSAIELFFEGVTRLNVVAPPENSDGIIFHGTLLVRDGQAYWSPERDWSPDAANVTFVSAKQLRWRDASDWLGADHRLGIGPPTRLSDGAP